MDGVQGHRRPIRALSVVAAAAALLVVAAAPAAQPGAFISGMLRQEQFSPTDLRELAAGQAVVKPLDTTVRRELANFGAVHIGTTPEQFVERFKDIERFERGPGVPLIGRFSSPPRLEDLASLRLPAKDVVALQRCRLKNCDVQLTATDIARFRNQVDWTSPNAAEQANRVARQMLLELLVAYQASGNAALGSYESDHDGIVVADEVRALLDSGHTPPIPMPGLKAYLLEYPRLQQPGATDLFYWSIVDFGLKPTIRLAHVVIQPLAARPSGVSHVIAIKQLYASHYFHTTLELRFLVDDPDRRGFHLLSITRSRHDGMTGFGGSLLRPIISRRSRNAVRVYLEHLKRQVENPAPR